MTPSNPLTDIRDTAEAALAGMYTAPDMVGSLVDALNAIVSIVNAQVFVDGAEEGATDA